MYKYINQYGIEDIQTNHRIVHSKFNSSYNYITSSKKIWWYQRENQNPWQEEVLTIQCPNEKGQKDKQRSTKHYAEN